MVYCLNIKHSIECIIGYPNSSIFVKNFAILVVISTLFSTVAQKGQHKQKKKTQTKKNTSSKKKRKRTQKSTTQAKKYKTQTKKA